MDIIHDSMISIMHKYPHYSFDKEQLSEMLTFADTFDDIGYGFAAIKCSSSCMRSIIIDVDPEYLCSSCRRLHQEGYRLKGKYKLHSDTMKKFSIKVEAGQYDAIIFKKRRDATQFEWPTQAINIYKKELKDRGESMLGRSRKQGEY
jgi:hypothetical protein